MARFIVISSDVVINIIEAETLEIAEEVTGLECLESYSVGMYATRDSETGEFIPFVAPEIVDEAPLELEPPIEEEPAATPAE